jgi:hypothetical protein
MTLEEESPTNFCRGSREGLKDCKHYNHSSTLKNPVNSLIRARGRVIGRLEGGIFYKHVRASCHMLFKPQAWAIDAEAFDKHIKSNATQLVVIDTEAGIEYRCPTEAFDRLKRQLDRGFGTQYFLTLNHWQARGNGHRQLGLWGGGR